MRWSCCKIRWKRKTRQNNQQARQEVSLPSYIDEGISRFSHSTLDSIRYNQELLGYNVGVLFRSDNINTLDTDSEFRLVVMAGVAQGET